MRNVVQIDKVSHEIIVIATKYGPPIAVIRAWTKCLGHGLGPRLLCDLTRSAFYIHIARSTTWNVKCIFPKNKTMYSP